MKKLSAALILSLLLLSASGCSARENIKALLPEEDSEVQKETSPGTRVYMDEICGIVKDFDGSQLTLLKNPDVYVFDVSQADLECKGGIITGDEINVIYEGRLNSTDTSSVKVLKVVDPYHNKTQLEERKIYGQIQDLTANSITVKSKTGKTATYPITGTEQYYQNGLKAGNWVYLRFRGVLGIARTDDPELLNTSHLKVYSVSDIDPLKIPEPTPTPKPQEGQEQKQEQKLQAVIQNVHLNTLQVIPEKTNITLNLDMSAVPCHFSGGISVGARVTVTYTGQFNGTSLEGMTILGITGDIPEKLSSNSINYTVSGEITSSTANTVTILSPDGMYLTFLVDSAVNHSTGGLLTGSNVKLTFNPADSRESNIYTCLKIEDA